MLTNVLSVTQLATEEALTPDPCRWGIERMCFRLKEVLSLNRLDAANPNAVTMQVYAAAIVYNASGSPRARPPRSSVSHPRSSRPPSCFPWLPGWSSLR